jgi:hypothetical protein
MADNLSVTQGSGTTIAADDIGGGILAQRVKPVWGPDGTGNDVDVASGKPFPVQIRSSVGTEGSGNTGSATFTTGTTAYAAFDCVGASGANAAVDFGAVGRSGNNIMVTSVELEIDSATIISGETSYNLYFYNVTPPSAINDSSPFTLGSSDRAAFLGKVALPSVVVEGVTTATLYCRLDGINQHMLLSGTHLFGYLVSVGAFTPTARVYKITVHTLDL